MFWLFKQIGNHMLPGSQRRSGLHQKRKARGKQLFWLVFKNKLATACWRSQIKRASQMQITKRKMKKPKHQRPKVALKTRSSNRRKFKLVINTKTTISTFISTRNLCSSTSMGLKIKTCSKLAWYKMTRTPQMHRKVRYNRKWILWWRRLRVFRLII